MCLGIPGRIIEILSEDFQLATVEVTGVRRTVNVGLLAGDDGGSGVGPGDWVLVHVGFALNRLDEDEAATALRLLREMGAAYEEELALLQEEP